jgi:hypothetical protein
MHHAEENQWKSFRWCEPHIHVASDVFRPQIQGIRKAANFLISQYVLGVLHPYYYKDKTDRKQICELGG